MNETGKTLGFATAAVLAVALGIWSHWRPAETALSKQQIVGKSLFELKPEAAKSLEIIEYDPDTAEIKPFKVAQEKGVWVIPSHENYPADAAQQLGDAAAALVACETINIESEDPSSHATYGVIDPDPKSLTAGTTGVGKRVTMEDGSGKKLAQLIIGKGIKDKPDLRYVRIPGQDPVYVVKLKTDKFSTKFEDWIEKDLLKLNAWDIERVAFNDYSVDELQQALLLRSKIQLTFDNKAQKWNLDELEVFRNDDYEPEALASDEELNAQKLNELKTALDDLKIVDVRRKPAGLAADLRAGDELVQNTDAKRSLLQRGFIVASLAGQSGIFSNEGEIHCGTKEGVEYTLRFGRIAGGAEMAAKDEEEAAESAEGEPAEKKETGANRFIMVTVQFNEDLLAKPELTPLPGEKPTIETGSGEGKEEQKDEADKTSALDASLSDAAAQLALADDEPTDEDAKTEGDDKAGEAKASAEKAQTKETKGAKGKEKDDKKPDLTKPKTPQQLEQERITKENERRQKEYDNAVKKGQDKVKDLSGRFADWYYIVSDSTYQKIHLGRDEIVKKKTAAADPKKGDAHQHDVEDETDLLKEENKKLTD
ncbi:MAG TPA: DUF4340 domain-containing protein [Pirellulales bacterium]|nr:DUF4340 domain-containing protein [Pirellulales bacterium]